jgi:hypothetical protein
MCGCSYCSWTRSMDVPDSTEWLPCAAAGTMLYCRLADHLSSITAVRPDLHHSGRMARKVNDGQQGSRWSACSTWYASPHISVVQTITKFPLGSRPTQPPRLARDPPPIRVDRLINGRHAVSRVGVPRAGTCRSRGEYQRDGAERVEWCRNEVCAEEW